MTIKYHDGLYGNGRDIIQEWLIIVYLRWFPRFTQWTSTKQESQDHKQVEIQAKTSRKENKTKRESTNKYKERTVNKHLFTELYGDMR